MKKIREKEQSSFITPTEKKNDNLKCLEKV